MAAQVSPSLTSSLNPNAALFVPSSAQFITIDDDSEDSFEVVMPEWDVEDFSPEWWNLVQTSPEFCEFWIHGYEANDADDFISFIHYEDVLDLPVDQERDAN
ncbi:hypothetical protein L7F22_031917 [Adiantum nelumboides]|nr:hypothetical protein [Adiantum nelumboides]